MTKKEAIDLVSKSGSELKNLTENFKDDSEVVISAVTDYGESLEFASDRIKSEKNIVLIAVKNGGYALEFCDSKLKKDKEVVMEAVKSYGWAIKYASESLKADKEIVMESLREYGNFIRYASEELKKDKEVVLKAISNWPVESLDRDFFLDVPEEMHDDADIMLAILRKLNLIDNINILSKSEVLLKDDKFIQKLISHKLVSSQNNLKYKKTIGKYTIVADLPPKVVNSEMSASSYDSDLNKTYFVNNLHVENINGIIHSPIIECAEILKDGYVMTFSTTFWRKGFLIFDDLIYFILPGEEVGYGSNENLLFELKEGIENNSISFDNFIDTMLVKSNNVELKEKINSGSFPFHKHIM